MRRGLRTTLAVLMGLAPACAGTSTGNPNVPDPNDFPGEAGGGNCEAEAETLAGLDAETPLGFSAADMLALTEGHGEITLLWRAPGHGLSYGPESGEGTLQIEVTPKGAAPRFLDRRPRTSTNGGAEPAIGEIGVQCPDLVELDVNVHVSTGGGALDERFEGKLRSTNGRVARIYVQLDAEDLQGSFDAEQTTSKDAVFDSVQLDLSFSAFGAAGSLGVAFTEPPSAGPTAASSQTPAIAQWPAGVDCQESRFGAKLDQQVGGFSAQLGIERFNAAELQLTAAGGSPVALTTSFTATSPTACVVDLDSTDREPSLEIEGTLSIRSEDGRIDGSWPVGLRATAGADGSLARVEVAFDLYGSIIASLVEAAKFESTYGVHDIDVSGYDQAGIVFEIEVGPASEVSGQLTVNGAKLPNCPAPAPPADPRGGSGSPGCPGISLTPLWTATFSAAN